MAGHTLLPERKLLLERYLYDPQSGRLTWKAPSANGKRQPGDPAGKRQPDGSLAVKIDRVWFAGHRLIWKMVTGDDPGEFIVDHRDGDRSNNRFENLRLSSYTGNSVNRKKNRGKVLPKGVQRRGNSFVARIGNGGQRLGTFPTAEEAHLAYLQEAHRRWGEFATSGHRDGDA